MNITENFKFLIKLLKILNVTVYCPSKKTDSFVLN